MEFDLAVVALTELRSLCYDHGRLAALQFELESLPFSVGVEPGTQCTRIPVWICAG